jgi:NADP-dependent 3-hydroxy acid dehydrogenase YdfG
MRRVGVENATKRSKCFGHRCYWGIGGAIAHDLARRGCAVIVTGRRQTHVTRLVTELGPPARCLVADLTKPDEIRNLLAAAEPVDVLVANAGIDMAKILRRWAMPSWTRRSGSTYSRRRRLREQLRRR